MPLQNNLLAILILHSTFSSIDGRSSWIPEKDVTTELAAQRQEELARENVHSQTLPVIPIEEAFVSMENSCPGRTIDRRNGPVYVGFQLPHSSLGTVISYSAGQAYRHVLKEDKCYYLSWSDHSFLCDPSNKTFVQLTGSWLDVETIPENCANGEGMIVNDKQPYETVAVDMPLTCNAETFDVHNSPIHVQFSLPESTSMNTFNFSSGRAGKKNEESSCSQIQWTDLSFICDPAKAEWTLSSGSWTTQEPANCASWAVNETQSSNIDQESIWVMDTTNTRPCSSLEIESKNGPILVQMSLPSDHSRGSSVQYQAGEVYQWLDDKCYVIQWTDHNFVCDTFQGKWMNTLGSFIIPDNTPDTCTDVDGGPYEFNTDQPHLRVIDLTQLDQTVPTITTNAPSTSPSPTVYASEPPLSYQRPMETSVPQGPTPGSFSWPTRQPSLVVKPLETNVPISDSSSLFDIDKKSPADANSTAPTMPPSFNETSTTSPTPEVVPDTLEPSQSPSLRSSAPSATPTSLPTVKPTSIPPSTSEPTQQSVDNSDAPSGSPTSAPTQQSVDNSDVPSGSPTSAPTQQSVDNSDFPSGSPSAIETQSSNSAEASNATVPQSNDAFYCGCPLCNDNYWNRNASGFTCGERIEYVASFSGGKMMEACAQIAGEEFPKICGPVCDPDRCLGEDLDAESIEDMETEISVSSGESRDESPSQAPSLASLVLSTDAESPTPNLRIESGSGSKSSFWASSRHVVLVLAFTFVHF